MADDAKTEFFELMGKRVRDKDTGQFVVAEKTPKKQDKSGILDKDRKTGTETVSLD